MLHQNPSFTIGIEEEYLIVDAETCDLVEAPDGLMEACSEALGDKVSPEFLQCQIEVGTSVCSSVPEAREDLANLRRTIRDVCHAHGVTPIASSTHPFADWGKQQFTEKDRYRALEKDLAAVARRMLICGMHVHVGIDDDELRIDLLNQFPYFLPHLLALSASSPFWEGAETGLHSYRLTIFDNLPRTGLPPSFVSFTEYQRSVNALIDADVIDEPSKIWWDLRPSTHYPTLESRICDVTPRLNDAIAIAAITQSLMSMLYTLRANNQRWRQYDRFLIDENRWRALRYGCTQGLIDFGTGKIVPFEEMLHNLVDLLSPYAAQLGCLDALRSIFDTYERGTSAQRQVAVYTNAVNEGASKEDALRAVVKSLIHEFSIDL